MYIVLIFTINLSEDFLEIAKMKWSQLLSNFVSPSIGFWRYYLWLLYISTKQCYFLTCPYTYKQNFQTTFTFTAVHFTMIYKLKKVRLGYYNLYVKSRQPLAVKLCINVKYFTVTWQTYVLTSLTFINLLWHFFYLHWLKQDFNMSKKEGRVPNVVKFAFGGSAG